MKGMKPIIDIWTNVINNEEAFITKRNEDKDLPVQLEKSEIFHLYEILGLDEVFRFFVVVFIVFLMGFLFLM